MTKETVVANILEQTEGTFKYQEQIIQLGLDVLGLTLAEADQMRKAFGKKNISAMEGYHSKLREALGEEKGSELFSQLLRDSTYAMCKTVVESMKAIHRNALQTVVSSTDGKVVYVYQLYLVLSQVAGLSDAAVDSLVSQKTSGENINVKQYVSDLGNLNPRFLEDVIEEIVATLPEDFNELVQIPAALVAFQN